MSKANRPRREDAVLRTRPHGNRNRQRLGDTRVSSLALLPLKFIQRILGAGPCAVAVAAMRIVVVILLRPEALEDADASISVPSTETSRGRLMSREHPCSRRDGRTCRRRVPQQALAILVNVVGSKLAANCRCRGTSGTAGCGRAARRTRLPRAEDLFKATAAR